MRNVVAIAKKELNIYFTTPIAYAMFAVMTLLLSYVFAGYVNAFSRMSLEANLNPQIAEYLNATDMVVYPLVVFGGVFVVFIAPFLSMRLIAEEKRQKTFELLMTSPLRPVEIVLGKYLGGVAIMGVAVLIALLFPIILHLFAGSAGTGGSGGIEWQTTLLGFFGLFLWSSAAMAIGIFVSSLTSSQAVSAIVSLLVLLLMWLASWGAMATDGALSDVMNWLSAQRHLHGFARGVFDLKDLAYYLSWIVLGLFLTHRAIEAHRWA
ncbi:MAG: ABC transporter permease [Myxococcales bacterium]|jgi:ABC-2 type transport system permease protein